MRKIEMKKSLHKQIEEELLDTVEERNISYIEDPQDFEDDLLGIKPERLNICKSLKGSNRKNRGFNKRKKSVKFKHQKKITDDRTIKTKATKPKHKNNNSTNDGIVAIPSGDIFVPVF